MRCITKFVTESLAKGGIFIQTPYTIKKVTEEYVFIKDGTSVFVIKRKERKK